MAPVSTFVPLIWDVPMRPPDSSVQYQDTSASCRSGVRRTSTGLPIDVRPTSAGRLQLPLAWPLACRTAHVGWSLEVRSSQTAWNWPLAPARRSCSR